MNFPFRSARPSVRRVLSSTTFCRREGGGGGENLCPARSVGRATTSHATARRDGLFKQDPQERERTWLAEICQRHLTLRKQLYRNERTFLLVGVNKCNFLSDSLAICTYSNTIFHLGKESKKSERGREREGGERGRKEDRLSSQPALTTEP